MRHSIRWASDVEMTMQEILRDQITRESMALELRIEDFMKRTGLSNNDIVIVHFRERRFPQWKGAIPAWRQKA